MIIGVPKEIKSNENRVSLTPGGAAALCRAGHPVQGRGYVELTGYGGSGRVDAGG